jgi:hypothetical protein
VATNHEANVLLGGDASGAQAAAKAAAKDVDAFDKSVSKAKLGTRALNEELKKSTAGWGTQAEAAKKAEQANFVAAARMENAAARAAQIDKTFGKVGQSSSVAANGITRVTGAAGHGRGPMMALGSAVHNVSAGQATLSQATNMVLSSFGPWGMVIGAAVGVLGHFITEQLGAADAAEKATQKIREEVAALKDMSTTQRLQELNKAQRKSEETGFFGFSTDEADIAAEKVKAIRRELGFIDRAEEGRKNTARQQAEFESKEHAKQVETTRRVKEIEAEIFEIEKAKVAFKNEKVDTKALEVEQLKLQASIASELGDMDESAKLLRQAELRDLEEVNKKERGRTKEKEKQLALMTHQDFSLGAAGPNFSGEARRLANAQANAEFGSELELARNAGLRRDDGGAFAIAGAQRETADSMRAIGMERATDLTGDGEIERIEREKAALLSLTEVRMQYATTVGEKEALLEEQRSIRHDAEIARIDEEKKEQQQRQAILEDVAKQAARHGAAFVNSSIDIAKAKREATKAALLEGKTSVEAARIGKIAELEARAARMDSIRQYMVMKAFEHAAEAIGAFARYDFVGGGLHLAAAAAFGIGAAVAASRSNSLGAQADSLQARGGGGGSGAGAGGGSGGTSPRSGPAPIDSSIPGSPGPQAPSSSGGGSSGGGSPVVITGNTYHLYGTSGQKEYVRQLDQDLSELSHSRRRAS